MEILVPMPGTRLKGWLDWLGFHAGDDCHCDHYAATMDRNGIRWCLANLGIIVGWLQESAGKRGVWFNRTLVLVLVWLVLNFPRQTPESH